VLPAGRPYPHVPGLRITHSPLRRGYRWFVSNPLFVPYIGRVHRKHPCDVLRVHSLRFTGTAALIARRLYDLPAPVIAHHHHLDRDRWTNHIERRVAQQCDMIITGSEFSRQQLCSALDVLPERVEVVHYGVSEAFGPHPRDDGLAAEWGISGQPVLLYLGSLKPRKNLPTLLAALRLIQEERNDARLLLVGQGDQAQALRHQAQALGMSEHVRFVGFVPEADKVRWYNLADVFVLPSRLEGFGLAAAEAMACGKPVVASRAASLPEVVAHGETGLLCDPDDPGDFAQAITRILRDRELAAAMGQAGRDRVRRFFQWDQSVFRTLALYEEAIRAWQIR
jgi:glycosyltransferase involved in cell wall biosynthesis